MSDAEPCGSFRSLWDSWMVRLAIGGGLAGLLIGLIPPALVGVISGSLTVGLLVSFGGAVVVGFTGTMLGGMIGVMVDAPKGAIWGAVIGLALAIPFCGAPVWLLGSREHPQDERLGSVIFV